MSKTLKQMTKDELVRYIIYDKFLEGYFDTSLWASVDDRDGGDTPLDENFGIDGFTADTLREMIAEAEKFRDNPKVIEALNEIDEDAWHGNLDSLAGYEFWMTRNGHGVGFWVRPEVWGDYTDDLTELSETFGEAHVYVGDSGLLYYFNG